jgi:hypothetical protein
MFHLFDRRWLRFSLRGMLILIALIAIWFGYVLKRMHDRLEAIRAIDEVGGTYGTYILGPKWIRKWVNDEKCLYDRVRISLGPGNQGYRNERPVTDDDLARLAPLFKTFSYFTSLRLYDPMITDEGMRHVAKMQGVKILSLGGTSVTDRGLEYLAELSSLEQLEVGGDKMTDAGIAKLQKALPNCKISR